MELSGIKALPTSSRDKDALLRQLGARLQGRQRKLGGVERKLPHSPVIGFTDGVKSVTAQRRSSTNGPPCSINTSLTSKPKRSRTTFSSRASRSWSSWKGWPSNRRNTSVTAWGFGALAGPIWPTWQDSLTCVGEIDRRNTVTDIGRFHEWHLVICKACL